MGTTTAADILATSHSPASSSKFRYRDPLVAREGEGKQQQQQQQATIGGSGSRAVGSSSGLSTTEMTMYSVKDSPPPIRTELLPSIINPSSTTSVNPSLPRGKEQEKGKGKATSADSESTLIPDSEKYLMRSLSGPSDQKAGLGLGLIAGRSKEEGTPVLPIFPSLL